MFLIVLIPLEIKLLKAQESDSNILKFVLCENLFSNLLLAFLPRLWTFMHFLHTPWNVYSFLLLILR